MGRTLHLKAARMSVNVTPAEKEFLRSPLSWTFIVIAIQAIAAVWLIWDDVHKANLAREEARKRDWQTALVFSVIDRHPIEQTLKGLPYDQIKTGFLNEVSTVPNLSFDKNEMDDLTLHRILLDLMKSQLIGMTEDGSYTSLRAALQPRYARPIVEERAKIAILHILGTESGKYNANELGQKVMDPNGLRADEYAKVLSELFANLLIAKDANYKIWSNVFPPVIPTPIVPVTTSNPPTTSGTATTPSVPTKDGSAPSDTTAPPTGQKTAPAK